MKKANDSVAGRAPNGSRDAFSLSTAAGLVWVDLMAEGTVKGRRRSGLASIIAALAPADDCIVVYYGL